MYACIGSVVRPDCRIDIFGEETNVDSFLSHKSPQQIKKMDVKLS